MSNIDPTITNSDVIPVVESRVFENNQSARFASGILAVADQPLPGLEQEYAGYFNLRRKVYVDQTGQLHESELQADGTDRDMDDTRSIAFGVIENRLHDQRIVAATRLIIKGFDQDDNPKRPLPVEEFCPDVFGDNPAPTGSVEVSRMISRHERAGVQAVLKWQMYANLVSYITTHKLGPTFAVVEPWFERDLNRAVPVKRIGEPRYVEHYLDVNVPLEVDVPTLSDRMKEKKPGLLEEIADKEGEMLFFGEAVLPIVRQDDRREVSAHIDNERRLKERRAEPVGWKIA